MRLHRLQEDGNRWLQPFARDAIRGFPQDRYRLDHSHVIHPRPCRLRCFLGSLPQGANRMLAVKAGDVSELVEDLPLVGPVRVAIPLCDGLNQFSSGLQTQLPLGCGACYL